MIIDAFPFWREFECLEIRFRELKGLVDTFVVVEAPWTHAGEDRDYLFSKRGREIAEKVGVDVYYHALNKNLGTGALQALMRDAPPDHKNLHWARENYQRQAIREAVANLVDDYEEDYVLISDADEIPSKKAVQRAIRLATPGVVVRFNQPLCYYYLNACLEPEPVNILCSRLVRYRRKDFYPQEIRRNCEGPVISPGGWHFGWLGDAERAREKIQAFAHQEMNTEYILADGYLEWCVEKGKHPGEMRQIYRFDEDYLPECVRTNVEQYRQYLAPQSLPGLSTMSGRTEAMDPWTGSEAAREPVRSEGVGAGDAARRPEGQP
jgi:Glycosyltransferase family 17